MNPSAVAVPLHAERAQTLGEEIANAISHGLGFLLALAALPILVLHSQGPSAVVGASLFAVTMMLLYGVSTLYHALPRGRAKRWFNRLDHAAIFVFIAGSYTPFTLGVLSGPWGWSLFGVVWSIATLGVTLKLIDRWRHPLWSTGLYLAMGWVVLAALAPLIDSMPAAGLAWLLAGGLSYTLGAVVFSFDSRWRYAHALWHLFVLGGSACHFIAVLHYAS